VWEAIAGLIAIVLSVLRSYLGSKRQRAYEEGIRKFDKALVNRDADALSCFFDELRIPAGEGDTGGQDD